MARTKKARGPEELLKSMGEGSEEITKPYIDIKSLTVNDSDLEAMNEMADDVDFEDADGEADSDKTTEIELSGTPKARSKPAAAKSSAPRRKRKEPKLEDDEITAVIAPLTAKPFQAPALPAPVKEPVTVVAPEPDHLREDVSIASVSLHKTMDSMVRQWSSVKEISGSICLELERVNTMLKTPAAQPEPADIREYLKHAAPRITLANKVALGVSAAAVVFSIVSLSLASSTRHTLLEQSIPARIATERPAERPMPEVVPAKIEIVKAAPVVTSAQATTATQATKVLLLGPPKARRKPHLAAKERHTKGRLHRAR